MSNQHVEVRFKTDTKGESRKISSAVAEIIGEKIKMLKKNSNGEVSFLLASENPIVVSDKPDILLNLFAGFISGLLLGVFVVFWKEYFCGREV